MLTLSRPIDEHKCYETVRRLRWPKGVCCVECGSASVTKRGKHQTHPARQRYACLYLMGLNLSNQQIAQELSLHKDDVHQMTSELRQAVADKRPEVQLSGTVEFDEVYVTTGHKGQPESIKKKADKGGGVSSKGYPSGSKLRGRGTLEKEKPPIFGMIQRGGEVVIRMLANVQQKTIQPIIQATVSAGTLIYTDEYDIYARLETWGYTHKSVCHSAGEYARDEDSDGFCEVHVNTMEEFWSLLRSWLRPHRGISQEKLPLYLGFFEFVHNARKRGKALLDSLLNTLLG